jgi:uncharacterized protein YdeI (YjbR/CyaY-like superfamily)
MKTIKPLPPLMHFTSAKEWHDYLKKNYTNQEGVRLKFAKKESGAVSISQREALEIALMFGWIDGLSKGIDEKYWSLKFTPRRAKSMWSKRNCEIVERLVKEKKMQPSGMAQIEAAKKDGRWDRAYDSPKNMVMPQDFLQELSKNKKALSFFETLNKTNKYAIGWRLQTAKKPETRIKRMKEILIMMTKGEKLH